MAKTYSPKAADIKREWHIIDAKGQTLGRVATEVSALLRGKHKAMYSPHMDTGDFVVVINAAEIVVSGNKLNDKIYYHHTMWPGGFRQENLSDRMNRHPTWPLFDAIKGMIPHSKLGRAMIKKLKIYAGSEHPHSAQQPKEYEFKYLKES
ncbi:50S ribosomal protein L13 [Candidatus Chlorohelix sp.]|uniref:50S ribosomal protein L13 n=1 Tax=Candidatus Chlorohelix sp. TaxID=3139201 RepID=UPI003031174C